MPEQHDPSQATASTAPSAAVESASEDPEPDPDASAVSIPSGARLVLATHNAGKLEEMRSMIPERPKRRRKVKKLARTAITAAENPPA